MVHPLLDAERARRMLRSELGGLAAGQLLDAVRRHAPNNHGHLPRWLNAIAKLRGCAPHIHTQGDAPRWTMDRSLLQHPDARASIHEALTRLGPWRKGPFEVGGIHLDAEWRCDLKWRRIAPALPLSGARVLDVGCGNGYYCLRAWAAGARVVVGVDPTLAYVAQWAALEALGAPLPIVVVPVGVEHLEFSRPTFDCVLSMGVIYHRRSPLDHLLQLRNLLVEDGLLVLESLVAEGPPGYSLVPAGRYAGMRNVWFIPSTGTLQQWLQRCGFELVRVLDESWTTAAEQRTTPWSGRHSLSDVLDPKDPRRTVEGHPAPRRAALLARACRA